MKTNATLTFAVLCLLLKTAHALELPKVCYETVDSSQFCTTDHLGDVQVFVYNAGWCPPCNMEMDELSVLYKQFVGKPVTFASLSGEGYQRGSVPDKQFLKSWKQQHHIPFVVAGKYKDFGQAFEFPGYIPFTVIVDQKGNVVDKGGLDASEIIAKVKQLLSEEQHGSCLPDLE